MLRGKRDDTRRLVHAPSDVPNVEVFGGVHNKELAEAVHETGGASLVLVRSATLVACVVVHCAPVYLNDWKLAGIAPDSDGRRVGVMIDAKRRENTKVIRCQSNEYGGWCV